MVQDERRLGKVAKLLQVEGSIGERASYENWSAILNYPPQLHRRRVEVPKVMYDVGQPGCPAHSIAKRDVFRITSHIRDRVDGARLSLPSGVDLSAYRIVQEGLTNTMKHGRDVTRATVALHYRPDELSIEVSDDGAPATDAGAEAPTGHGLIGMRERMALYGGELLAGPRASGGFEVRARFPLEPDAE